MNFSKYTTQELEFIISNFDDLKSELEKRNIIESDNFPFKDGDVIHVCDEYSGATFTYVVILKQIKGGQIYSYCFYSYKDAVFGTYDFSYNNYKIRLATEEEKTKLFQTIKDNGYKWNPENKTLEKFPKFQVGDKIKHKDSGIECTLGEYSEGISAYRTDIGLSLTHKDLENWELIPNKFDVTTLKPFKSEVLVRNYESDYWKPAIFGFTEKDKNAPFFVVGGNFYYKCIPYEENQHLLGTTNDCDNFYKTWE